METLDTIAARFDARAPRYDDSVLHVALADAAARFAARERALGGQRGDDDARGLGRVLDVATGTGLVLRALAALGLLPGATSSGGTPQPAGPSPAAGLDASAGMLAVARTHLPGVAWTQGDAQALPFSDGAFDLVTCVTGLHLMSDPVAALTEWRRVLVPDGRVVLATFATDASGDALRDPGDPHARVGSPALLAALADRAGLRVSRSERWEHRPDAGPVRDACLLTELVA
ncbi:class I SAM-dependent methyltransferase [Luteimicrobium sp. NPDC057192]|uniref:class I SAM-dependent methyltransferase n=1 Tax=Luteimicrobium sp. NPDC057192 TaxID=3346042 RepID=UPI00363AC6BF